MSQLYSTYPGKKAAEQPASGDGQEWLSCAVCSLTFKNQQHYSIHCGGTFHANRVAASLRTQQTATKGGLEDTQSYGSSSNPSYWTGMQQAFPFTGSQQHDSQTSVNRSQSGQSRLNTGAELYPSNLEYISYPVGKQTKQSSDAKTAGGYEGLYGMPGFGWSDAQQDSSAYQFQQQPAAAQLPELQQAKGSSSSKSALHDNWKNYQPQPDTSGAQAGQDYGSKKPVDYGYSTQDLSAASYASQKSDVPSWLKMIEPAVSGVQKTESYMSSNKAALYGSHNQFSGVTSTKGTEDPWKSAPNYEVDIRGQIRRAKEESSGKAEQPARGKTRWDTGDSYSRDSPGQGKQRSGSNLDRRSAESRRREERDMLRRDGKEGSNSRSSEDLYHKRDSSRWEDANERGPRHKQGLDARDNSKQQVDSYTTDGLSHVGMSYSTKRTEGKREFGSHVEVSKSRENSSHWDSSYTEELTPAGGTGQRDLSFGKAGRNRDAQIRDQGLSNRAADKQGTQQVGLADREPWDTFGSGWEATGRGVKPLQVAEAFGQKTGYDQQHQAWGGETVHSKNNKSWMQAESGNVWDAAYVSAADGGNISWSGAPGYRSAKDGLNEKMSVQGRADKNSWNQKEIENSLVQHNSGNTWPIAKSGGHIRGSDMRYNSGTSGEQEWPNVDDVLAKFKQASKGPGQKPGTDVGPSAYGSLNQGLGSYTTRPMQAGKTGKSAVDPKGGFDWIQTCGAKDKQAEFGASYKEQEFATSSDPYHQGVSDWRGNCSDTGGGFSQPGLGNRNKAGQLLAQGNQWAGWSDEEQRDGRVFAKDQLTSQTGTLGRGQPRFQEANSRSRGTGFGRSELKGVEKQVGLSRSVQPGDRAESQDFARPFNLKGQGLLGESPSAAASSENASRFRALEGSGAAGAGRGAGRGAAGNKPSPRPGEISGWQHGFQEQSQPPASIARGGPIRGSESTPGQKNSWGFSGTGVRPTAAQTKGFEKGFESKAPSNIHEKMQQFGGQGFTRDWNEKGKESLVSGSSVRTSVGAASQRMNQSRASVAAAGQKANQSSSSVPSLLNLKVMPTAKSQKSDSPDNKYSKDTANDEQKSGGIMQQQSSAFGGKKSEQIPGSTKTSGGASVPPVRSSVQESVPSSAGKSLSSGFNKPQSQPTAQPAAATVPPKQGLAPKQPLLPTPSVPPLCQNKQTSAAEAATKKPSGPALKVMGGPGEFNPLDPASARKAGSISDNKLKTSDMGSFAVVSTPQASVTATKTGISSVVISKELTATTTTRSASKLDSKVTPAAAETKIGLKSSAPQHRGNGPPVTCSSSATVAQPAIEEARPTALTTSSTGSTANLDSSKKPVVQKSGPVARRSTKRDDLDNEDECDPALSEALGQFFSEGKDVPAETVKPAIPAKKTAGSTKFVPTIRTYAVKSLAGFSKENQSSMKDDDSSSENTKRPDANATEVEPSKKTSPDTVTVKVEKDESVSAGAGNDQKAEGKAGDPIAELANLLPPNLMKEITSGHPSKELLEKVADLLPADVLKQAVEYLQSSGALKQTEKKESEQEPQIPGVKADATSKAKADEEKLKMKAVETSKQAGKLAEALPGRVQVIQPRKGIPNPVPSGSGDAKGPFTGMTAKTPDEYAGNSRQPGTSVMKPPVQGSGVPGKRKYNDIDPAKLNNLSFDDMLQLFQELLQDVLGGLFEEDQKASAINEKRILDSLSVDDREMALKVRQMTGINDLSKIVHTMNVLQSLNSETIQALGQLDKSIITSSLTGNEKAQKMGGTVLHQITDLMAKGASAEKQLKGPQGPVGCGRGSVRPSQPGSSSGRGVQSLLTLNFTESPKLGVIAAGLASASRALLPTPQRPRFPLENVMPPRGMGLLPTPLEQGHFQNFPQPFLRKRGPPPSDEFFSAGPPIKRWR